MLAMPESPQSGPKVLVTPILSALAKTDRKADDITFCERCGAEMYRMHAVWRCPACRFKTDCCGW
jgi:rubrerythrin